MPSWETNCIEDWETKIDAIVEETFDENMTVIQEFLGCKCTLSVCNKGEEDRGRNLQKL
jgi:hypothetical protein